MTKLAATEEKKDGERHNQLIELSRRSRMSLTKKSTEVQEVLSKTTLTMDQVDLVDQVDQIHWMARWMGLGLGWCLVHHLHAIHDPRDLTVDLVDQTQCMGLGLGWCLVHHLHAIRVCVITGLGGQQKTTSGSKLSMLTVGFTDN